MLLMALEGKQGAGEQTKELGERLDGHTGRK